MFKKEFLKQKWLNKIAPTRTRISPVFKLQHVKL